MADPQGCTEQFGWKEDENKNLYTAAFDIIDTWFKGEIQFKFSQPRKLKHHSHMPSHSLTET